MGKMSPCKIYWINLKPCSRFNHMYGSVHTNIQPSIHVPSASPLL